MPKFQQDEGVKVIKKGITFGKTGFIVESDDPKKYKVEFSPEWVGYYTEGELESTDNPPPVKCELCGKVTEMDATKRCDTCWELERRIHKNPKIALKIITAMESQK